MLNTRLILQRKRELGLSYKDISDRLGYSSPATTFKILNGSHELKAKHLKALAAMLEVNIDEMFTESDNAR